MVFINRPFRKLAAGNIQVAIWQNEGKNSEFYTVTISRRFKDKNDEWQNSNSFRLNDIPKVIAALQEAYKSMILKEQASESNESLADVIE